MPNPNDPTDGTTDDSPDGTEHSDTTVGASLDDANEVTTIDASREQVAVQRARMLSDLLDEAVRIPGTNFRVGLDPVLGILPGAGDAIAAAISLYPVVEAYRLNRPTSTILKMLALIAIDAVVGSIPLIGPLFDTFWKANKWNVRILENSSPRSGTPRSITAAAGGGD